MFFGNEENVRTVAFYSRGVTGRMVRKGGGGQVRLGFILEIRVLGQTIASLSL